MYVNTTNAHAYFNNKSFIPVPTLGTLPQMIDALAPFTRSSSCRMADRKKPLSVSSNVALDNTLEFSYFLVYLEIDFNFPDTVIRSAKRVMWD